jgi:carbonic anhydrase
MSFPERLIEGYRLFLSSRLTVEQSRYRELAESGQSPEIMVIGCCDSRVSPEVIFDSRPGELFVMRNVANLVPSYSPDGVQRAVSAAVEFAVQALKVKHIVVLGHAHCGGIRAFVDHGEPLSPGDFIGKWMELLAPAAASIGPQHNHSSRRLPRRLEHASAIKTLDNLLTFPYVRNQRTYATASARRRRGHRLLSVFDPETKTFASAAGAGHSRLFAQPRF